MLVVFTFCLINYFQTIYFFKHKLKLYLFFNLYNMDSILVIYHHKTGCVLVKNLFHLYKQYVKNYNLLNNVICENNIIKEKEIIKNFNLDFSKFPKGYQVFIQASPNFIYNIKKQLKFKKIIHFVRDPYEQSVSNFNYHVNEPSPEEWFLKIHNQVYKWFSNKDYLNSMFHILDLDVQLIKDVEVYLKSIYTCKTKLSYYDIMLNMKKINEEHALIIETLRFIFETKHILKMACIAKLNKKKMLVFSFDDFKEKNIEKTINKINKYLFPNESINTNDLIKSYLMKYNSNKNGVHISKISKTKKEEQMNILKNNIYIKTIFDKINTILHDL